MARGRSLRSYLLLPRPGDSVKWAIFPAALVVGVLARGGISAERVLSAAVLWFILELLIYQARYQWNDIRGFAADQLHPQAATRGRLPGPPERGPVNKLASYVVAAGRLVLALVLAMVVPGLTPTGVAALALGVFGLAVAYEALRGRATGRSSAMPPPLTPSLIALWLVVGGGYALRGMAGLAVAFDLPPSVVPAAVAAIALWSFGVAFVTGRWALEALAFARMDGGQLTWSAGRQHAREHSLALVRWLPDRPSTLSATGGGLNGWQALWEHSGKV